MINRKLIRPSLADVPSSISKFSGQVRKRVPPEQTHAENFYYVKQMNNKTIMVVKLTNGEEITGYIEWYDRDCIKLNRETGHNLLIYKVAILYVYKADETSSKAEDEDDAAYKRARRSNSQPRQNPYGE